LGSCADRTAMKPVRRKGAMPRKEGRKISWFVEVTPGRRDGYAPATEA
jgi:hypothetical protein